MKQLRLIENRSEIGAGTRGASLGIDALKVASLNQKSDFFSRYSSFKVKDRNELLFQSVKTPTAIRIEGIREVYENVAKAVKEVLQDQDFPLVLAADHASAGGTIAGIKMAHPDKRLGVIWIDAHGDLHSPYTSPTGNVHGMPLATALSEDNLANKVKEPSEEALVHWTAMKELGGVAPKIEAEDLIFFGVRDTESPEDLLMKTKGIKNFTVAECRKKGLQAAVKEALQQLSDCDMLYISFDVDSMDSEKVSKGTGTPVPNGFLPEEALTIIKALLESKKVCCFELVEVNPTLDNKANTMAETAFEILNETAVAIEKQIDNE
ncbi:MAG: arginase [Vicingaceae bacterium]